MTSITLWPTGFSVQFKSLFIVYTHIVMTYKGRTLRSLVQSPIGLTGNEDYNTEIILRNTNR